MDLERRRKAAIIKDCFKILPSVLASAGRIQYQNRHIFTSMLFSPKRDTEKFLKQEGVGTKSIILRSPFTGVLPFSTTNGEIFQSRNGG
jgi:hypothetical protein